ncbi:hypothetical protein ACOMHN_022660 [Nucella lapillus]
MSLSRTDSDWTLWVGLKVTSLDNMTWEDGKKVDWTNWHGHLDGTKDLDLCVSVVTSPPYSWQLASCNETFPSLCEISGGSCRFTYTPHASLTSWNDRLVSGNNETCLQRCQTIRDMDCRSVEVNREIDKCQFSTQTRWTQPQSFGTGSSRWDYYHWTCVNGTYLSSGGVSPNGVDLPTVLPTTLPPASSSAPQETTDNGEEEEVVCVKVNKTPSANETKVVEQEVRELQTMARTYKEQKRLKKKVSTPNTKASATYVGSLAVGLVLTVLGFIVCLDLLSLQRFIEDLHRHGAPCGKCARVLSKKKGARGKRKRVQFSDYPESSHTRPGTSQLSPTVFVHSRFPRHFRPLAMADDPHLESVYSQESPQDTPPEALDTHTTTTEASLEYERLSDSVVACSLGDGTQETDWRDKSEPLQTRCSSSVHEHSVTVERLKLGSCLDAEEDSVVIERNPEPYSLSGAFSKQSAEHTSDGRDSSRGACEGETRPSEHVAGEFTGPECPLDDTGNHTALGKNLIPLRDVIAEVPAADLFTCESHIQSENVSRLQSQESLDFQEPGNAQNVLEFKSLSPRGGELNSAIVNTSDIVVNVMDDVHTSDKQSDNLNGVTTETIIETEVDNNVVVRF